ncbi:MAG: hypothetical protein KDA27_01675 [Candidatus Eisenbacteria bacterium]|uniref:Flagellar assembly protein FliH/Type III secretion system HrpE domain-containing protein n=1 Tax=Eiseniibacteriota bacterium TaxID=2212470 RepID=A0A956N973_UNCEI|nr:hypothetical protein [Candidatus Eisenbacteria bacterium]
MSSLVRNIVDSGSPLRLAPPRDGKRSREAPLLYTERDMSDAVRQAVQRGREEAAQEAEAYVRRLDRNVESALEAVGYLLEGLEAARRDMLDLASRELIELALMVARSVVGSEIELRPESIQPVVDELLEELRDAERVTIRVHPDTLHLLQKQGAAVSDDRVRWVADVGLGTADARVDSDRGGWDAAVETRWARVADAVRAARTTQVLEEADNAARERGEAAEDEEEDAA